MILYDKSRQLPAEWTDDLCRQLVEHAIDLGRNGNPSGFLMSAALKPFIGYTIGIQHYLKPLDDWDFDGIRKWIERHQERVEWVWRLQVRPDYW